MTTSKSHTTADEMLFVKTIGIYHEKSRAMPRLTLLQNYLRASLQRENWGAIDKIKIINFTQDEIASMQ